MNGVKSSNTDTKCSNVAIQILLKWAKPLIYKNLCKSSFEADLLYFTLVTSVSSRRLAACPLNFKSFRVAKNVMAGIELMHMIRKGQFLLEGCIKLSFAEQFYALARKIRPV